MSKKLIFLFLALLLPGLIYTFLRVFGSNSFYVAPLFQTEVDVPAGCADVKAPYVLPENVFASLSPDISDSLFLIFYELHNAESDAIADNLSEIRKSVSENKEGIQLIRIDKDTLGLKCPLMLKPGVDIVILDKSKRIRGQYTSTDRDEVDRLSTELDVMLKKY